MAGLLKSLMSIRALQIKYAAAEKEAGEIGEMEPVALLDGGATHALRQARPHESDNLTVVEVGWLVEVRCCTSMPRRLPF